MTWVVPAPTFRDPEGSLALEENYAVRTIRPHARQTVLEFLTSPFYKRAQERGDIVSTEVDDSNTGLVLRHPRIAVPSYPWEWTPPQWVAAGRLTLDLCDQALDEGWILKDATPLNILFVGPKPVLVDVLSFDRRATGSSIWPAYGQYVRTFLLPLLMNRMLKWPMALSFFRRDGFEPAELYHALSWSKRLSPTAFWPITLPAWLESSSKRLSTPPPAKDAQATLHILKRSIRNLRTRTERIVPASGNSAWSEYKASLTHYTAEQNLAKREWLQRIAGTLRPARVLDIGANTGEYSALLANAGTEVVALERDAISTEQIFFMSRARNLAIQAIHADLARPTPATGWENNESMSLLTRLEGRFDLVLMLALIHHLVLLDQIPLPAILALCHRLTSRHLVIEWVPSSDPMYQELMRGRESLYGSLSESDLLAAASGLFRVVEQHTLGNGRILYLFEKNL